MNKNWQRPKDYKQTKDRQDSLCSALKQREDREFEPEYDKINYDGKCVMHKWSVGD